VDADFLCGKAAMLDVAVIGRLCIMCDSYIFVDIRGGAVGSGTALQTGKLWV
jgi:hypothetical protein